MPTLLLEIGCEELPAAACREAAHQLPGLCEQHLGEEPRGVFVGPRRIAVLLRDLPERTADEWVKGPPEKMRDKAAAGFAKRHGVAVEDLSVRDGFLGVEVAGRQLRDVLPERLGELVRGLQFGKSMRWGPDLRFPRPVRWLLAKLDGETVPVEIAGIPFGDVSYGHRFVAKGPVQIGDADSYLDALRAAGVEPDGEARRRTIVEGLDALGGWSDPGGVLEEVVYLAEAPEVLEGRFDERFLQLPEPVIVAAMQSHQRAFPLGGNRVAFVTNGGEPDVARAGHLQVIENRLDDAAFTYERDVEKGIAGLAAGLGSITFLREAGSFADKTERLVKLVEALGGGDASIEAARLAKVDQAAELVREFPELEGRIGAEYARLAGYPEAVCAAIEEHYLPDSAGGPLPQTEAGKVLAAAEKLDNLKTAFGLDLRPTGSRDPYGLRRAAIGLCRLALEGGLDIDVQALAGDEVADFVEERLEGLLDVPVEFVRAARAPRLELHTTARLAETLAALDPGRLGRLHTAYSRADRLAGTADDVAGKLDRSLLTEQAELEVAETLARVDPRIEAALAARDLDAAFDAAEELAHPVDRFFDEVLVMADEPAVRANRLRLLLEVRDTVGRLGDFSELPL